MKENKDSIDKEQRSNDLMTHKDLETRLADLRSENHTILDQYEKAMELVNSLTVKVEISQLEFTQIFDAVGDPTWVINNQDKVIRANDAFLKLLNLKKRYDVIGRTFHELLDPESFSAAVNPVEWVRSNQERHEIDIELDLSHSPKTPYLLTTTPLFGLTGEIIGVVEQYKDITERKRYEQQLENANSILNQLATIDSLTQLANRRHFDDRLKKEWLRMRREKQPLSLILCDIDFFKKYNDFYGHPMGDECLKRVAQCIRSCVLRPADLVARYGGEEFVIILPNTPLMGASQVAEKIRKKIVAMKIPHSQSEIRGHVTLSFGLTSIIPSLSVDGSGCLLKKADEALYQSKGKGRNCVTTRPLNNNDLNYPLCPAHTS